MSAHLKTMDRGSLELYALQLELRAQSAELAAEKYRQGHNRYEKLRRLNVTQFQRLYQRNIRGEGRFDDLVDEMP